MRVTRKSWTRSRKPPGLRRVDRPRRLQASRTPTREGVQGSTHRCLTHFQNLLQPTPTTLGTIPPRPTTQAAKPPPPCFAKRREASLNPNIDFRRMCGDKSSSKSKSLAEHGEQRTAPLRKNGRHSGQFVCSCLSRHSYCDVFPACACRTRSGNSDGASCCACAQAQLGGPVLLKQGYMQARPSPKSRRQPAIPMDLHW